MCGQKPFLNRLPPAGPDGPAGGGGLLARFWGRFEQRDTAKPLPLPPFAGAFWAKGPGAGGGAQPSGSPGDKAQSEHLEWERAEWERERAAVTLR